MNNDFIKYQLNLADPSGHRFHICLTIPNPDKNGQILRLPAWIPGSYLIRDFARQIETIKAFKCNPETTNLGDNVVKIKKLDSNTWQCEPVDGALRIEYIVYAWDLSVRGAHFDESHAFFNGTSVFLAVTGQENQPCLLDIVDPNAAVAHTENTEISCQSNSAIPSDWKVYTSLPRAVGLVGAAELRGFGLYQAPNYDALIDYPVEIGTPQVTSFIAFGAEHDLVFTGVAPNLDMARIAFDAHKICATQIELFEPATNQAPFLDSAERYTFLTMITGDDYGGLEHRASTALMISRKDLPSKGKLAPTGYANYLGLISHEYFHTWNVKRIKPAVFAPYDLNRPNHTDLLWVFEGFTSYYDDLMLLRSAVIDEKRYFELLARNLDHVARSPGRFKQSVAESSFDAWTRYYKQDENSPNALVSYYSKGALLAMALDLEIRWQTNNVKNLDNVMRLLWDKFGRDFYKNQAINSDPADATIGKGVAEDAMPDLIQQATGLDLGDFIERYAYGTEDIPLQEMLARVGINLTSEATEKQPSLNIRSKNEAAGVKILTVYEHGAAHQAGLSAGDLIIAIDGLQIAGRLNDLLATYQVGDKVKIHVFRRDELRQFTAVLAEPSDIKHKLTRE